MNEYTVLVQMVLSLGVAGAVLYVFNANLPGVAFDVDVAPPNGGEERPATNL